MRGNRLLNLAITNPDPKVMIKAMDSFLEYCQTHFETEEAMLERIRYPKAMEHREFHAKLLEEARIIRKELDQGIVNPSVLFHFLVDRIVVSHLLEADSDFYPYASGGTGAQGPQS
jgi:hemerythrin-like metal-binding protein